MAMHSQVVTRMQALHGSAAAANFVALVQLTGRGDLTSWLLAAVIFEALAIPLALVVAIGPVFEPKPRVARTLGLASFEVEHGYILVWGFSLVFTWVGVACIFGHFGWGPVIAFAVASACAFRIWNRFSDHASTLQANQPRANP